MFSHVFTFPGISPELRRTFLDPAGGLQESLADADTGHFRCAIKTAFRDQTAEEDRRRGVSPACRCPLFLFLPTGRLTLGERTVGGFSSSFFIPKDGRGYFCFLCVLVPISFYMISKLCRATRFDTRWTVLLVYEAGLSR